MGAVEANNILCCNDCHLSPLGFDNVGDDAMGSAPPAEK